MDILHNPVILFFLFGIFAGLIKSNLEIPQQIVQFLSLYLLMSIGLKGGLAIGKAGLDSDMILTLTIAVGSAIVVPLVSYQFLKRFLNTFDAAAVAATFGSISAVTFVTANQYLDVAGVQYDNYMSAAMALMESPAIIIGVMIANMHRDHADFSVSKSHSFKESFVEGANLLLLASLLIGVVAGPVGYEVMKPFTGDLFTGLLAFFLLDMGIQVSKHLPEVRDKNPILIVYAIVAPVLHAMAALAVCYALDISLGNTVLLMVLSASASYIAVPAALKTAMPEAKPSVYLGLSLGVTFPFNVIVGIPVYYALANGVMN